MRPVCLLNFGLFESMGDVKCAGIKASVMIRWRICMMVILTRIIVRAVIHPIAVVIRRRDRTVTGSIYMGPDVDS